MREESKLSVIRSCKLPAVEGQGVLAPPQALATGKLTANSSAYPVVLRGAV
jgi:hypothetical protein